MKLNSKIGKTDGQNLEDVHVDTWIYLGGVIHTNDEADKHIKNKMKTRVLIN